MNKIRTTQVDDFGNVVLTLPATGKGPCRVSLKPFVIGKDTRLLFKHSPFDVDNVFNQPGTVFINAEDMQPYQNVHRFPPEVHTSDDMPITLIGYDAEQMMVFTHSVIEKDIDTLIVDIFNTHAELDFLHARHAEACCYICKIERT